MAEKYTDYKLEIMLPVIDKLLDHGYTVFMKWTCKECGERAMMNEPIDPETRAINSFAHHEEKDDGTECGAITDMRETGGNYMVMASGANALDLLLKELKET